MRWQIVDFVDIKKGNLKGKMRISTVALVPIYEPFFYGDCAPYRALYLFG